MHSLSLAPFLLSFLHVVSALWPMPHSLQTGNTILKLSPNFKISTPAISNPPQDLVDAINRTMSYLKGDQLGRLVVGRGANDSVAQAPSLIALNLMLGSTSLPIKSITEEATKDIALRLESYSLSVPSTDQGTANITASSSLGLLRGLTTFTQLWYQTSETIYTYQAPVNINDTAAYPYRGLLLDTARNYIPVTDIKRTLDAMSMVKLNQLHWHAVDSQSFALQIPSFPELSRQGAYSPQQIYTTDDIKELVVYAAARGIDVMVEIDTPGHTASIGSSHPEHIACLDAMPWATFANEPPAGQLRITSPATGNFTVRLLSSVAELFPSTMFSIGGDEVNAECYNEDTQTKQDLASAGMTWQQALNSFTQNSTNALRILNKTVVVWQEMALDYDVNLPNDTIVMVWQGAESAANITSRNLRIVQASSDYFYLDCGAGAWLGSTPNGNSWCDPFKSWQKAYTFDPLENLTTTNQTSLVLGGQQLLWTEQSGPENLDSIVWPRAAAAAEVFWTGPKLSDGTALNVTTALPRLHDIRYRMVQRGVKAINLQPQWCALRSDESCDYVPS